MRKDIFHIHDPSRTEVALRVGVTCLLAFILVIADLDEVVPPNLSFYLGLMVASLAVTLPHFLFSILLALPSIVVVFFVLMAAWTMMMATATVSDGLYCTMYALYTFFMHGLYFGMGIAPKGASMIITMPALISSSYLQFVRVGGLEAVKSLWTEKGIANPLALNRNMLIIMSWGLVSLLLGRILPPFRTFRQGQSRVLLPHVLTQAASVVEEEQSPEDRETLSSSLLHLRGVLDGGNIANLTVYEPRLLTAPT